MFYSKEEKGSKSVEQTQNTALHHVSVFGFKHLLEAFA